MTGPSRDANDEPGAESTTGVEIHRPRSGRDRLGAADGRADRDAGRHRVGGAGVGRRLVGRDEVPGFLTRLVDAADGIDVGQLLPWAWQGPPKDRPLRRSAVLMAFGEGPAGPDLLLTARASTLRSHAGQPAFPGGRTEQGETAVEAALREAQEETGLDPAGVNPLAVLPELFLLPSEFLVIPVLAHWFRPVPVSPMDPGETAAVDRVPIAELSDPANRGRVRHPSGYVGPAFEVAGLVVWGFTAGLIDGLLRLGGWELPWDQERIISLPAAG